MQLPTYGQKGIISLPACLPACLPAWLCVLIILSHSGPGGALSARGSFKVLAAKWISLMQNYMYLFSWNGVYPCARLPAVETEAEPNPLNRKLFKNRIIYAPKFNKINLATVSANFAIKLELRDIWQGVALPRPLSHLSHQSGASSVTFAITLNHLIMSRQQQLRERARGSQEGAESAFNFRSHSER